MRRDVSKICNICEHIQIRKTAIFCSKSEYNAHKKITRQIKSILKYIDDSDLNQYIKMEDLLPARKKIHSLLVYNQ